MSTVGRTLSPAEVADRLGVPLATVALWIAAGDIRTTGEKHRVTLEECDRFRRHLMGTVVDHYADDIAADLRGPQ